MAKSNIKLNRRGLEDGISEAYLNISSVFQAALMDYNNVKKNKPKSISTEDENVDDKNEYKEGIHERLKTEKLKICLDALKVNNDLLKIMEMASRSSETPVDEVTTSAPVGLTDELKKQIKMLNTQQNEK